MTRLNTVIEVFCIIFYLVNFTRTAEEQKVQILEHSLLDI